MNSSAVEYSSRGTSGGAQPRQNAAADERPAQERWGLARNCSRQSVAASTLSSSSLRFEPSRSRVRSICASILWAASSIRDSP